MADLLARFLPHIEHLYSAVLADVLDTLGHRHSALPGTIRPLRPTWKLFGRAATLNARSVDREPERPYLVEMECIDALKPGDVLVAAGNGDASSALWGELLSTAARAHGANGVVLDALTRDATKILEMDFPVWTTGFCPLDSKGRLDATDHGQPVRIGAVTVHPGDYVFADLDGVVIIPQALADQALTRALEKISGENLVRDELARGRSVKEVFEQYGIL